MGRGTGLTPLSKGAEGAAAAPHYPGGQGYSSTHGNLQVFAASQPGHQAGVEGIPRTDAAAAAHGLGRHCAALPLPPGVRGAAGAVLDHDRLRAGGPCSHGELQCRGRLRCGALGHGLPMAVGMAFAARLRGESYHTYCIMGDGETQEGSTWEAVQFAVMHELGNLTLIVDRNRLQAMDFIKNVMDRDDSDIYRRFQGFGLEPLPCPGHDTSRLQETLRAVRQAACDKPGLIIAETVKGQGLACMQDVPKFHFRIPTEEELKWNR